MNPDEFGRLLQKYRGLIRLSCSADGAEVYRIEAEGVRQELMLTYQRLWNAAHDDGTRRTAELQAQAVKR